MYYILLIFIFSVIDCFNPELTYEERNYSKSDVHALFVDNLYWNEGDIPLLNKKVCQDSFINILMEFSNIMLTTRSGKYAADVQTMKEIVLALRAKMMKYFSVFNVGQIKFRLRGEGKHYFQIFKGIRVTIREHPYIASIRRNIMHYSVATMLTKNLFVSVAHPLIDVPLDELGIVVGENYADRGATLLTVMLLIFHEDFDRYTLAADLVLIRVYEDTPYRCSVKSIQMVHPRIPINGQRAFVTGWGRCDRTVVPLFISPPEYIFVQSSPARR